MIMNNTILIIEDDDEIRDGLAELLGLEGFEVATADGGPKALAIIRTSQPALIICDILMPDLDGYEVLDRLRKSPDTQDIPLIFSSAYSEKKEREKAASLGVNDFFVKPFDIAELLKCVRRHLNSRTPNC